MYSNMLTLTIFSTLITYLSLFDLYNKHDQRMRCSARLLEQYKEQVISLKIAR